MYINRAATICLLLPSPPKKKKKIQEALTTGRKNNSVFLDECAQTNTIVLKQETGNEEQAQRKSKLFAIDKI